MSVNMGWVLPEHQEKASELTEVLEAAIAKAEKSARFIAIQLDPRAVWQGWPSEVAEAWLESRPTVLGRYFEGVATASAVAKTLKGRFHNTYRIWTGERPGTKAREAVPGLDVPAAVSAALDEVTWDAVRRFGAATDETSIRQLVKVPAPGEDDHKVVVLSAGTVQEEALTARYTSIRGNLYWSDVRNSLELWIRARPELLAEYADWAALGQPRAFHEGGRWVTKGENDRREHNPLVHIQATARKRAQDIITRWARDGFVSLDALMESGGEEAVKDVQRARPERRQHVAKQHFAWGLRDDVACYSFPVVVSVSTGTPS